jgi:tRNA pseudouridine32 synthase/23S rRNA pseudouridine746 synthase
MLEGLAVASVRAFDPPAVRNAELRIVFEDDWLVVVDKPAGQLSVPGRSAIKDSVLARLRARSPEAPELLLVHRLDMDTSGLLVAAKDLQTHKDLQRQFARREVHKRYAAWVAGGVDGAKGTIDLPMRADIGDRPRQIHDPLQGKSAVTDWVVEERMAERTRVALFPRTGRTHQLRVHAAHPLGLGSPIVGDRLYGHVGGRLMLHAEALEFRHPQTGQSIRFESPAPF